MELKKLELFLELLELGKDDKLNEVEEIISILNSVEKEFGENI